MLQCVAVCCSVLQCVAVLCTLLKDSNVDDISLSNLIIYRQELSDFMNRLANDEIECNIFSDLDEFVELHFPKLI